MHEIRVAMGLPSTPPAAPVVPEPVVPPPPFAFGVELLATDASNSTAAPALPVTVATDASRFNFVSVMRAITTGLTNKTLDQAAIPSALAKVGIPSLPMLASRPELIATFAECLGVEL